VIPASARFVVVGAGVHGLCTAYHLAEEGADVVVLEKQRIGAGASGISGGIVRNFYLSAAMNELVARSVEIFELDPSLFGFQQVGYIAIVPAAQEDELERIAAQHVEVSYPSAFVRGDRDVTAHMRRLFPDWRARGSTALLHETRSGWADARTTVSALAGMARSVGAQIVEGTRVTGFDLDAGVVETTGGRIRCDTVVLAPGPWARDLWRLLELPSDLELGGDARVAFHYWQVREGEFAAGGASLDPRDPVVHLDADVPVDGMPVPWGIYFRPGLGGGVAVGGLPVALDPECELDPYGPSHSELGATDTAFDASVTGALAWALGRFEAASWSGGSFAAQTCFTPDSYPIAGFVRENVYAVLDSNHGFKLLALGQLAARELLGGREPVLDPFRLERFAGAAAPVHPASASPYPWT